MLGLLVPGLRMGGGNTTVPFVPGAPAWTIIEPGRTFAALEPGSAFAATEPGRDWKAVPP